MGPLLMRRHRGGPLLAAVALSAGLHGAAWGLGLSAPAARPPRHVELEVVRRAPPPRPAPPAALPARPAPPPRRERPALARAAPPPAPAPAPAPPPSAAPPPPRVGISLGATVGAGGFAMGAGNTALGRAGATAADPASVQALPAAPVAGLAPTPARPLVLPRIPYPPEARRAGAEGQVVLLLRIDAAGAVAGVRVLSAPAPALAAAAAEGARLFRFAPATAGGRPIETEIRFTYTFFLE
ncbi:MAG: TonB family protein [Deltaproteobacteria bacterium]|nr:TonB family protein [Deltaproteobacteria bacterium]